MTKITPKKKKMMNGKKSNQIGISKSQSKKNFKNTVKNTTSPKTMTITASKGKPSQIKHKGKPKPVKNKNQKKKTSGRREARDARQITLGKKEWLTMMEQRRERKLMAKFAHQQMGKSPQVKKIPKVDPTSLISLKVLDNAVAGVKKFPTLEKANIKSLHDITDTDERYIYLQVTLCKLPNVNEDFHLIGPSTVNVSLPHRLVTDNTDVILITKDLQRGVKRDHENSLNYFKNLLLRHNAASLINEVIPLRQLKVECKEYEAKRQLANRTEVLLCDDTIMRFIPKFLSKHFYTKRRLPVQVNLKAKNLQHEVLRALSVSKLFFSMKGTCSFMKIARLSQTDEQIKENILAAVEKLANFAPGKWDNIQGLSIKQLSTSAIPIYVKLDSVNNVKEIPTPIVYRGKTVSDSLSTLPGHGVTVFPDGSVTVNKNYDRMHKITGKDSANIKKKPEFESDKKIKQEKMSATPKSDTETREDEKTITTIKKETQEENANKRKASEKKNSKVKKQKKADEENSEDSDSDEENELEEQENMYLRQLLRDRKESTGDEEEEEDSEEEEDVWGDSESDMEGSD